MAKINHFLWMPFIEHEGTFMYRENEMEKKRAYGDSILNVEKGSFNPLVFTTTGGMGPECLCQTVSRADFNKNK